jgi:hypothetical protein
MLRSRVGYEAWLHKTWCQTLSLTDRLYDPFVSNASPTPYIDAVPDMQCHLKNAVKVKVTAGHPGNAVKRSSEQSCICHSMAMCQGYFVSTGIIRPCRCNPFVFVKSMSQKRQQCGAEKQKKVWGYVQQKPVTDLVPICEKVGKRV